MRPYAIDIEYKKIDITISVSYLRTPAATQRVGDDQYQAAGGVLPVQTTTSGADPAPGGRIGKPEIHAL